MGIKITTKTKCPASLKLLNHINSFLFEQEYDELKYFTPAQILKLREAGKVLKAIIK